MPVTVVDAHGAPVAGANVVTDFTRAGAVSGIRRTDAEGHVTIPVAEKGRKTIYVLAARSFAVAQIEGRQAAGVRIVVPDGVATLHVRAKTTDDEPLAGVGLILRHAGTDLPSGVLSSLAVQRQLRLSTDTSGRAAPPSPPGRSLRDRLDPAGTDRGSRPVDASGVGGRGDADHADVLARTNGRALTRVALCPDGSRHHRVAAAATGRFSATGALRWRRMNDFTVDIEREDDGRWIGEVPELPGVMVYGTSREEAVAKAKALAFRVLADRLEHGEDIPEIQGVFAVHG